MHAGRLLAQHRRGALDHVGGRIVQCANLIQHEFLVDQTLRRHHCRAQRGHRGRGRAIDALDELEIVFADELERQVALGADGKLRGEILRFLANVEEAVLAQRLRPLRILLLHLPDASIECGIHPAGEVEVLLEPVHHGPQVDLLLLDRGIVLEQLVLPPVERLHDRVEMTLGRLVLAEVIAQPVAQRQDAEEPATVEQPAVRRVEIFDRAPQLEESAGDGGFVLRAGQRADRPIEHSIGHAGGLLDLFVAERVDAVNLFLEGFRTRISGQQRVEVGSHGGVEARGRLWVERDHRGRGRGRVGWRQRKVRVRLDRRAHGLAPFAKPVGGYGMVFPENRPSHT